MDLHALYLAFLSIMFVFWNSVRIFTYVPTIRKLLKSEAGARDYSLATWTSWVFSNGFFALYLWEQSHRTLNAMVCLNIGNTMMCLATSALIYTRQRKPEGQARRWWCGTAAWRDTERVSRSLAPRRLPVYDALQTRSLSS